jgi:pimeloyl-ACP methyl ester carboxylesterase
MRSTVVSGGIRIGYRIEGAGPPLVLLHGWSQMADAWWEAGYGDALVDDFKVIAIDRRGHGESDKPHDAALYVESVIVSDIVAVLAAEGVERAIVWGFSMGAVDAASLAILEPTAVIALVCGGDTPIPSRHGEGRQEQHLATAAAVSSAEGLETLLRHLGSSEEAIAASSARNDTRALSAAMAGCADRFPAVADIHAPSLWYEGSEDHPFSKEDLQLAAQFDVETQLISGADHVATFRRVGDVLRIVRPFLDKHRP